MRKYCKAYYLKDLRQFAGWKELCKPHEEEMRDETIVYLWDDFTVVSSPVAEGQGALWDQVTPQWREFCQSVLHFELPEDLYAVSRQEQNQV
ncbi:hypothetical protein EPA93_15075 [Ktedonosporobacter rubrisoli]|uniref:Uncharacterized protein n=1 Tax=Ktedonosporobacter rubrisoli TaxID=2509675 RepID=A0A4P6JPQ7_KTERU|nr:hypothetical protein [Ktedonosporobacter rubrisoli]QBD77244.1 hypothetical protein EPA93_15075 [Ktedonosporobacter rubrisoli]